MQEHYNSFLRSVFVELFTMIFPDRTPFFDRRFSGSRPLVGLLAGPPIALFISLLPVLSLLPEEKGSSPIFDPFPWGQTYGELKSSSGKGTVLREVKGESLLLKRGELEFHYQFFWKKQVSLEGEKSSIPVVLRGIGPATGARLYAVQVRFPRIPLRVEDRRRILAELSRSYGPVRGDRDQYFELEGRGTLVRGYLEKYRGRSYLLRIVFLSRMLGAERNEHLQRIKKEQERLIREMLRKKEQEQKRQKGRKKDEEKEA